jgi:hypothetical protein
MALSPNYGWAEPDNSSLVKNGAQDIRALGDAIDTSLWNVGYGQAGKNKIINGDFSINQRSFTSSTSTGYGFDRFSNTAVGDGTATFTAETFTPGAAPVAGYEGTNFLRIVTSGQTAAGVFTDVRQAIENVRVFAGQTATFSFWAKANTGTPKIALELSQSFGTGGSPSAPVNTYGGQVTLSTSWARYSLTVAVPSISGKTIGTIANTSYLHAKFIVSAGSDFNARTGSIGIQSNTFDLWGFQVEYGSKATPFQTATGTLQGELAACQRYYYRVGGDNAFQWFGNGFADSTTNTKIVINNPVSMRIAPSSMDFGGSLTVNDGVTGTNVTTPVLFIPSKNLQQLNVPVASGLTQYRPYAFLANNSSAAFVAFNAEL